MLNSRKAIMLVAVTGFVVFSLAIPVLSQAPLATLKYSHANYTTGLAPYSMAVADVNNDGFPDLLVANNADFGAGGVSVLLGTGNGTFQHQKYFPTGGSTDSVTAADFNGDGNLDLAAVDTAATNSQLVIMLGNGDGTFQSPTYYTAGDWSGTVKAGDLNNDGKVDLVVANYASQTMSILLGNGDGTFQPPITLNLPGGPGDVAIADLNNDGNLDLAFPSLNRVFILLGTGNGTFGPPASYATEIEPTEALIGDFNNDGIPDIAAPNACGTDPDCLGEYPSTVSVLIGNGDGTFKNQAVYGVGYDALSLALADVNGDGNVDIICGNYGSASFTVLPGLGNGSFGVNQNFGTARTGPAFVVVGSFNQQGAGSSDVAVTNLGDYNTTNISVFLNEAATRITLTSSQNPSTQGQPVTFTAAVSGTLKKSATPTGTVNFYSGTTLLGTGSLASGLAAFTTSSLPLGNNSITAQYSGNTSYNPDTSKALVQVVQ